MYNSVQFLFVLQWRQFPSPNFTYYKTNNMQNSDFYNPDIKKKWPDMIWLYYLDTANKVLLFHENDNTIFVCQLGNFDTP